MEMAVASNESGPAGEPGQVLRYEDLEMDVAAHRVRRAGRTIPLSPTEFRLLRHLIAHPERVFSRHQLRGAVWPDGAGPELRTIDVHIRRLRTALRAPGGGELIRTVRSAGYSLDIDA
jgi:two-component system phosphate regulon response regulator PhoB